MVDLLHVPQFVAELEKRTLKFRLSQIFKALLDLLRKIIFGSEVELKVCFAVRRLGDAVNAIGALRFIVLYVFACGSPIPTQKEFFGVVKVASELVVEELESTEHDAWELVMQFEEVLLLFRLVNRCVHYQGRRGRRGLASTC